VVTVPVPGQAYRRLLGLLEVTRARGVSLGLPRLQAALQALGSPEASLPAVHVAGTNGKGSTAAMTEAILRAGGWRTGLYTSPHLSRFTERIRIDGQEVDGDWLAGLGDRLFATGAPVTYFEAATALGFLAMAEARVEVAVLEVGLGGRLDATNLCRPVVTAITSISLDHMELLGDSLAAIAREKAGIAKAGVPLVLGAVPAEAEAEIHRVAAAVGAPVWAPGDIAPQLPLGQLRLAGAHQRGNAVVAAQLARTAAQALGRSLDQEAIAAGLAGVRWPGRLEWVADDVLLDAAHNQEGVQALVAALPPGRPRTLVMSVVRGKAAAEMIALLAPHFDRLVFTRSANSRSTPPEELAALVPAGSPGTVAVEEDARRALAEARRRGGLCVVAGSLFLVGEIRAHLLGEPVDPLVTSDPL
jgi:dihydrofolate synthase / folylpolyglutamate synthase